MNNALWSPRGAQARERTHTAGYTMTVEFQLASEAENDYQILAQVLKFSSENFNFVLYLFIYI